MELRGRVQVLVYSEQRIASVHPVAKEKAFPFIDNNRKVCSGQVHANRNKKGGPTEE